MNSAAIAATPSTSWLTVTPHRALFAVGAGNLCLSMLWWALWLIDIRWGLLQLPSTPIYAGWLHAVVLPYLVLAPFIFGFLFTVFPRWMPVAPFGRWHYLPTAGSLLLAQLVLLSSMFSGPLGLHIGLLVGLAGWTNGLVLLLDRLRQDRSDCWHARSITLAMALGWLGMLAICVHQFAASHVWIDLAMKLGVHGLLLPIYLSVAHRMFPFFAKSVFPQYEAWRPVGLLGALWALLILHLVLELSGAQRWLWLSDLPATVLGLWMVKRWWPPQGAPFILRALFVGLLWWPIGAALYSVQSLLLWVDIAALGRAPLHAYTIGLFGAVLVAMVSRVSRGHSGRRLEMNRIDRSAFIAIQAVAVLRILAEFGVDYWAVNAVAAIGWVLVLLPWLLQCMWIWSTPRVDGKPG
ncbi:NnrS family protein [Pseudomarimonas arenosa]|uniref:NnrS family protein n=1 Tax=Pseudomarimonas arenosa TaxID=2774145 RepID=UPI002FC36A9B